jgi:regulator of sigma E protease
MVTILATVIVLGILIFVHEFGHFLLAKLFRVKVEAFSLGFPPKLLSKRVGETEYRLSVVPLGGYVKMLGENPSEEVPPELKDRSFAHQAVWRRFLIVFAGPGFNLIFAALALTFIFAVSGIPYLSSTIEGIQPGTPAALAGLQKGDQIIEVGGKPSKRWDDLTDLIQQTGERPITLTIKRGDRIFSLTLTPKRMEAVDLFGQKIFRPLIGISHSGKLVFEKVGFLTAISEGVVRTVRLSQITLESIYLLICRKIPIENLGGPITIANVAGQQARMGINYLINFMAFLSVNLALLNLLPIPVLDGGHLFFFLFEAIRRKPVSLKSREMAQAVGLVLVLALMLFVVYQDLVRVFSGPHH